MKIRVKNSQRYHVQVTERLGVISWASKIQNLTIFNSRASSKEKKEKRKIVSRKTKGKKVGA